ncbi:hypothetical protein C1645_812542 [Glomus cerebriforme]|uniref:Uncharacterized protein n=1 Tax=Glomus cerebriforme TaxID=658196 RepID=A0A397TKB4_9GLOM|nr:hypothetical protein C1645_812542 [Glomus cerebriforme]
MTLKENEKLFNQVYQLEEEITYLQSEINNPKLRDEIKQLHLEINDFKFQITCKDISLTDTKNEFFIKSEKITEGVIRIDFLKYKLELKNVKLTTKNIGLSLAKENLEDSLTEKKDELAKIKNDLSSKISSESEVLEEADSKENPGVSEQEKDNSNTKTT